MAAPPGLLSQQFVPEYAVSPPPGGLVDENPLVTAILGAAKVTGRTNSGLSLGAISAATREENATVKDSTGKIVAQTRTTIPTSDEINCAKCHGTTDTFGDILRKHDSMHGTNLASQAPVLCQSCHADPILHTTNQGGSTEYFSAAMHKSHSTRGAACYDCHPGDKTQCSRSIAHTAPGGNCETCHGDVGHMSVDQPVVQMNMGWCLNCHEKQPNAPQLMDCVICHQ